MKTIFAALVAAALSLFAASSFAACAGINVLAGGCSQSSGEAVSASGAAGGSALIGFTAAEATNTSTAQSANLSAATPVAQGSAGAAQTTSTSTMGSASLGLAGSIAGAAGGAGAAYNGAGVGGFGINVFALPTP
jgi:hypothetical protein